MDKRQLFETTKPVKALAIMALPTVASQIIILVYNLADTWFIGRTDNPYMIGASNLAVTVYLVTASLANVFGVGGGSLMARLIGEKDTDNAKKVASYSITISMYAALAFSLLTLVLMTPLLMLLGANDNTMEYGKQYLLTTVVFGGVPTVLSMSMPQMLRNAGYAREAGIGVGLGSILNVALDPLFMFVILPEGKEVLGAGIATMISNYCSLIYFLLVFRKIRNESVLRFTVKKERINGIFKKSLYSVGIPAAIAIFLFDLVTIVINRLAVGYGDEHLAAMGIVLKVERIPINIGLGICLGMVPLLAYNFGAQNKRRMAEIAAIAFRTILIFSVLCTVVFRIFAGSIVGAFIDNQETVRLGTIFLTGRCFALPFMLVGYFFVNYMNAIDQGKVSFLLAILRHVILIIPILFLMNTLFGLDGLTWSQLVADALNVTISTVIYFKVKKKLHLTKADAIA